MNRDVLIDFVDKKVVVFDIIVIVIIYVRFVACVRVFVRAFTGVESCLLYTSPSPRDQRGSRMPSSA